ncbi:MAG: glycosyltransferase family 4 protein [Opitutales bacterium]
MSYVVAFNGSRDFYQVPWALSEAGQMASLVTDFYTPDWLAQLPGPLGKKARARYCLGISSTQVRGDLASFFKQWQRIFGRLPKPEALRAIDERLSLRALAEAQRRQASLLLYSYYAMPAFARPEAAALNKGLFMVHPLGPLVRQILQEDFARFPEVKVSFEGEEETGGDGGRSGETREACQAADFILCASAFTQRCVEAYGVSTNRMRVVPYGYDFSALPFQPEAKQADRCRFLFVGQGIQRKGLHHLLRVWKDLAMPRSELHLVTYRIDPGIRALAADNVTIHNKLPLAELHNLFNRCHVFVLPSLIEGFGFVLLEALGMGCYTIATEHTGLVDLAPPDDVGAVLKPGDLPRLGGALSEARERFERGELDAGRIRNFAEQFTWAAFRERIRSACADTPEPAPATAVSR